ncbi:MAG: D-aminoacylase [Synergistaceae bacterium]|jgi:N-acyl-D-amino-acid deacylase|nr:D-aminoacylase [Synergistaceae bacterium]
MLYDLAILNGTVFDGVGGYARKDVGIKEGRIVETGDIGRSDAERRLDAGGRAVAPGFIDVHAHSDIQVWQEKFPLSKVSQGITTELTGQCGISACPVSDGCLESVMRYVAPVLGSTEPWPWRDYASYRETVGKKGLLINEGMFIGHGNLRIDAAGFSDGPTSPPERAHMCELLRKELADGALGLSSGLVYAPGVFSDPDEMVELTKVCAERDAIYTTHMRNEASSVLDALDEALDVALRSGVKLVISHMKAVGRPNHGKPLQMLARQAEARKKGVRVYGDCYPYDASSTMMAIILPPWALSGGVAEMLKILASDDARGKIKENFLNGIEGWENRPQTIGWENLMVASTGTGKNADAEGLSLAELGQRRGKDTADALMDLIMEERGDVTVVMKAMAEEDVRALLADPCVMVCSDGIPVGGKPHPRLYGAITRYLCRYADLSCEKGVAAAVHKLTGLPAEIYRLAGIGRIEKGYMADITIFDPSTVEDKADFQEPFRLSGGIEHVLVGGEPVYQDKSAGDRRPGRFIRRNVNSLS